MKVLSANKKVEMFKNRRTIWLLRLLAAIVTVASIVIYAPWLAAFAYMRPLPDSIQTQVEQAIEYDLDGMIVYVDQVGKEPAWYSAGWHDREKHIAAKSDALFKIASISKLYVAVAIAKLAANNQIDLDHSLADYFPELRGRIANAQTITLKMMMQHRSGIANFTDSPHYWEMPPDSAEGNLALVYDLPANFAPGQDYAYSNTNYLLLGMLIDKISGDTHQHYIRDEILLPLGLQHTFFSIKDIDLDQLMSGYYVGIEQDIKGTDYGSMVATAQDVGIFLRALNDGSLFTEQERTIYADLYVYNHTGLIPGYQSMASYHRDIDTVIVQFNNTTHFSGNTWMLADVVYRRITDIVREQANQALTAVE